MLEAFFQTFIPLFVAIDVFGILPIFAGLTQALELSERRKITLEATITALLAGVAFLFLGQSILKALDIEMYDFQIAGGILLFILAINDLISSEKKRRKPEHSLGVVPLGIPLICGPAVLTALVSLSHIHPYWIVLLSYALNMFIVFVFLWYSDTFIGLLGRSGSLALSKIVLILLAAIGIMLVRKGIFMAYNELPSH